MTFSQFQSKQFPEKSVFDRRQFDFTTNLVKWIALRFAFILYKVGLSANTLDVFAILLSVVGFLLLTTAVNGEVVLPLLGILPIYFLIFVDFADGPIAKATGSCSLLGHLLDDLGCNLARLMLILLFGIYTESLYWVILSVFAGGVLIPFVPAAAKELSSDGKLGILIRAYCHKFSFLSVRFMLALLPLLIGIAIFLGWNLRIISFGITLFYLSSAILWLILSIVLKANLQEKGNL